MRVGGVDLASLAARDLARYRQRTIGLVFQQFHLIPYLTALENLMLAQYVHSMTDRGEAEEALRRVGLGERMHHLPSQLSGGEQQRVCIARALINQPPLILADEPTGNLDAVNEAVVMILLADLHQRGHTLILVTHAADDRRPRRPRDPPGARPPGRARAARGRGAARRARGPLAPAGGGRRPGVSVARRGVAELLADGLLAFADGKIAFTERGRAQAAAAVRRVRLAEVLLARTLSTIEECGRGPAGRRRLRGPGLRLPGSPHGVPARPADPAGGRLLRRAPAGSAGRGAHRRVVEKGADLVLEAGGDRRRGRTPRSRRGCARAAPRPAAPAGPPPGPGRGRAR